MRVLLPDSVGSFEAFRRLMRLDIVAGGLTTRFDMTYGNQVLTALTRCVERYGPNAKSRAAVAAWLKSPIGPSARPSTDPEIIKEAATLANGIVAEAGLPKAASLKPGDVPNGIPGDAVWKIGDILFTISVLPKNEVPSEIGNLNDLMVGGDAQKCRGDFFAGAMLDVVETMSVARAYTTCQTDQATSATFYYVMPRKQGGLYLLKTTATGVELTPIQERAMRELDAKIRATAVTVLSKL